MYMAHERRQYILRLLEQRGTIRTTALARELGVTDETIRTDLVEMQARGLLQRMHGGARYIMPNTPSSDDSPRLDVQLARLAASHITPGTRLYIDACSFARVLATQLQDTPCTFITPSPRLVSALAPAAIPHNVICTGGKLDKTSSLLSVPEPAEIMQKLSVQLAILCPQALRPKQAAYKHRIQAAWATAAAINAPATIVVVPSATLTATAEHVVPLPHYRLITEDNLPDTFANIPTETVPHISESSFNSYDY